MHVHDTDWAYHHDLHLINRTSQLYNFLSDIVDGQEMYNGWVNGDLYEKTDEKFGINPVPGRIVSCFALRSDICLEC